MGSRFDDWIYWYLFTITVDYIKRSEFETRWGKEFSLLHVVQTGFEIHPTSYRMGTGGSFPRGKVAGA
jgi:hypothetical protein